MEEQKQKEKWEFGKEPIVKQEWVLRRGKLTIPINTTVQTIMLFVITAFAYNYGHSDAYEVLKWTAYLSNNGIYNPETGNTLNCSITTDGEKVIWVCTQEHNPFPQDRFNNSLIQRLGS